MTTSTPSRSTAQKLILGTWCFVLRYLPDLLGWAFTLTIVFAIVTGQGHESWFTWTLALIAAAWFGLVGAPHAVDLLGEWRYRRTLLDLDAMGREQYDPTSNVWAIALPLGYEEWELYAPGQCWPDAAFPHADVTPTATMSAIEPGPAQELPADRPQTIEQIREWAVPWVEEVSGGRVVEMVKGWGPPYGANRDLHEVSVYARVEASS